MNFVFFIILKILLKLIYNNEILIMIYYNKMNHSIMIFKKITIEKIRNFEFNIKYYYINSKKIIH